MFTFLDAAHLFLAALILVTFGFGMWLLSYMARLLGEARANTAQMAQLCARIDASATNIAEITREVLRRVS